MNQKIINSNMLKNNLEYFKSFNKKITVMVKANAYGHGIKEIIQLLSDYDVKFGVATIEEAKQVRQMTNKPILIVEPIKNVQEIINTSFEYTVEDLSVLKSVLKAGIEDRCYLKINTGMNRFGFSYDCPKELRKASKLICGKKMKGLMTHFSFLDDENTSQIQYHRFKEVKKFFCKNLSISFGGSNVVKYDFDCDEVRVGIGFYGYENANVKPIMKVKSQVLSIRDLQIGENLGYGAGFVAEKTTQIAVVGMGYGDGLRRDLKGFYATINGKQCEIIGNICMDCMFVDVSKVLVKEGDEVGFERADVMAKHLGTISYEVLTSYSNMRGKIVIY